jgi:hypothetical protein
MGQQGRAKVLRERTWEQRFAAFEAVYHEAVAGKQGVQRSSLV